MKNVSVQNNIHSQVYIDYMLFRIRNEDFQVTVKM